MAPGGNFGSTPSPVVCTRALEFVNLVYSRQTVSICGEFRPDLDGFGLLGDEFRDATGGSGHHTRARTPNAIGACLRPASHQYSPRLPPPRYSGGGRARRNCHEHATSGYPHRYSSQLPPAGIHSSTHLSSPSLPPPLYSGGGRARWSDASVYEHRCATPPRPSLPNTPWRPNGSGRHKRAAAHVGQNKIMRHPCILLCATPPRHALASPTCHKPVPAKTRTLESGHFSPLQLHLAREPRTPVDRGN
jgi:hypothetical protein